ncbi:MULTISPECIES: hypothetical protein [unclassified Nocardia]|uniref:hypothetical protein n=1 Tax=unclassified Nocardia TaxID=2637762 RepID=UPI00278C5363|nr:MULTISPECIES: hypothetical protein [unclassified Nocardia]
MTPPTRTPLEQTAPTTDAREAVAVAAPDPAPTAPAPDTAPTTENRRGHRFAGRAAGVAAAISRRRELIAQLVTGLGFLGGITAQILDVLGFGDIATVVRIVSGVLATAANPVTAIVIGKAIAFLRRTGTAVHRAAQRAARAARRRLQRS